MREIKGRSNVGSLKDFKLSTLLELTTAINNNLPEERLFATFEFILNKQLNIGKELLTAAFIIGFGAVGVAFALAFGLGGREWAAGVIARMSQKRR